MMNYDESSVKEKKIDNEFDYTNIAKSFDLK